ncbi:MAG: GntR family transcriptional regulator [Porticoccaceae bacterium]|nr:MAG: GntR family transcriptional regulator [Porticoccaceae bacterium]
MFHHEALAKLLLRLTVGILILLHGISKITNPGSLDFIHQNLANIGMPTFIAYGVYLGEVIGPLMIIFGYYARTGALLVVINMVFAILLVHSGQLFQLTSHGGWALELQGLYLFGGLVIVLLGSGRYAIRSD